MLADKAQVVSLFTNQFIAGRLAWIVYAHQLFFFNHFTNGTINRAQAQSGGVFLGHFQCFAWAKGAFCLLKHSEDRFTLLRFTNHLLI